MSDTLKKGLTFGVFPCNYRNFVFSRDKEMNGKLDPFPLAAKDESWLYLSHPKVSLFI